MLAAFCHRYQRLKALRRIFVQHRRHIGSAYGIGIRVAKVPVIHICLLEYSHHVCLYLSRICFLSHFFSNLSFTLPQEGIIMFAARKEYG
jgi:hypothetical protein